MKEAKDSEIKLFGMNIAFMENGRVVPVKVSSGEGGGIDGRNSGFDLDFHLREEKVSESGEEVEEQRENNKDCSTVEENHSSIAEESKTHDALSEMDENSETTPMNEDLTALDPSKNEKDQSDSTNSEQKTLKKPDKILPCPRCNSMETKFCYHNNYNVNQPRHFCKRCQRYWTAGGTMRNVPVGAGRRKSKSSASHGHHIMISEALQASQFDALNGYHQREFKPNNGALLSFGIDSPRCESLKEINAPKVTPNGCYNQEQVISVPCKVGENVDDCSSGSSVTTSNSMVNGGQNQPQIPVIQNMNNFQAPIPCLPGVPWPYMWNPSVPMPAVSPSGFPMPFYPVPYWNYNVPNPWSIPWFSPTPPTPSTDQNPSGSDTNSPILGKHSRDGELLKPSTPEGKESSDRSILVPKTLRIDDPEVAAKSSIWATLGIKYDSDNKRRTMFNAFEPKNAEKKDAATPSSVLQANPAAFSRSLGFQETA